MKKIDTRPDVDCKDCPAEKENKWFLIYQCGKYPGLIFPCPSWQKHNNKKS